MSKQVVVTVLPQCDFCHELARYDSPVVVFGGTTWANTCPRHWRAKRVSSKLGTGYGQRLVLESEGGRIRDSEPLVRVPGVKF